MKLTPAIKKHYEARTAKHIELVQKYCKILEDKDSSLKGLIERGKTHDSSKYGAAELLPYIWLTWRYKCKDDGVKCELPDGMEEEINKATEHHIRNNRHHPEAHVKRTRGLLNTKDRDKPPSVRIDASKMKDLDLAEMVADWCAMAEERGNTPKAWADKNVNIRWKFTPAQTTRIDKLMDLAWGSKESKMQKTASQIADAVLTKLAFSVTDEGHKYDAESAAAVKKFMLDKARKMQESGTIGYKDPETGKNPVQFLKAMRYNLSDPFLLGGHPTAEARHADYVRKQHEAGKNAWNPFGGALTPIEEEEGGSGGLFGMMGKVKPEVAPQQ